MIDIEVAPNLATFKFVLNRNKLRKVWRREGRYLLRSNLCGHDPAQLWQFYIQLAEIEAALVEAGISFAGAGPQTILVRRAPDP